MKKKIITLLTAGIMALSLTACGSGSPDVPESQVLYTNGAYNFTIEFPLEWVDYTVQNRELTEADNATEIIEFSMEDQVVFSINVYTPDQWNNADGLTLISETEEYVYASSLRNTERMEEVEGIIETFTLN